MNLLTTSDIENNVFNTTISVKECGTANLTPEEEVALLKDFPSKIIFKNLVFSGKFSVIDGAPKLTNGESDEEVSLSLTNQEILLNESFTATYRIDLKKVADAEIGTILNTKELVCQAKCMLFETTIKAEIKKILADIRVKATAFTGETEEII